MNFIPFDNKTKRIVGGGGIGKNFPEMVTFPPGRFPVKGSIPYLEALEDPTFEEGEEILVRKERNAPTFVFYCDSVSGGKDLSGKGIKTDPYRSLSHLFKMLYCRGEAIPSFLGHTKMCVKIYLKGVVDYDIGEGTGVFPFVAYQSYKRCYDENIFIITRWEDDLGSKAIIKDQKDLTFVYTVFQGIHFQDFDMFYCDHCYYENCVFSNIAFYHSFGIKDMDCYRCEFKNIGLLNSLRHLYGRFFKDCSMVFQVSGTQLTYEHDYPYLALFDQKISEGCTIEIRGENIFDFPIDYDSYYSYKTMSLLLIKGIFHENSFHVEVTDKPETKKESFNGNRGVFAVGGMGEPVTVDCKGSLSLEYTFEKCPEVDIENNGIECKHFFDASLFNGPGSFVRCSAENRGLTIKNGEGRFCGFKGGNVVDCEASPSNFKSGCLT